MKRPFWPLLLIVMKTPTSPEVIVVSHSRKTTVFCLFGILLKVGTWITWQLELGVFLGIGSWNLVFFLGSAVGTWCFFWNRQLELGVFFGIGSWNLVFFLGSYLSLTSPFVAPRGRSLAARAPRNSRFEE